MPATYEPIATTTTGAGVSTITFSSITSAYTDLRIAITFTGAAGGTQGNLRFNGDSGTNYSFTRLNGNGSTASSGTNTNANAIYYGDYTAVGTSTTIPEFSSIDIFSYAGSTFKTVLENSAADYNGSGGVCYQVGLWRNTAAITSITLILQGGTNFGTGSTATLYGIKNA
jgi:hypothetical protein